MKASPWGGNSENQLSETSQLVDKWVSPTCKLAVHTCIYMSKIQCMLQNDMA